MLSPLKVQPQRLCKIFAVNQNQKKDTRERKMAIIETAAKLLRNDIKDLAANKIEYPSPSMLESTESNVEFLPETLKVFLETFFKLRNLRLKLHQLAKL